MNKKMMGEIHALQTSALLTMCVDYGYGLILQNNFTVVSNIKMKRKFLSYPNGILFEGH